MKAGVIGTGSMGEKHVRTYLSLKDECELAGIYDTDKERAKKIAEQYNIHQFDSLEELLKAADVVSIAVPTKYHYETAAACLDAKVHILIEKPFTDTVWQADKLIQKAKKQGVILQVGHIELYNPLIPLMKSALRDEKVLAVEIRRMNQFDPRNALTDVVQDLMIHDLYLLSELFSLETAGIYGTGVHLDGSLKHASALFTLPGGETAHLTASFKSADSERTIRIITEQSSIKADLLTGRMVKTCSSFNPMTAETGSFLKREEVFEAGDAKPLTLELIDFIRCAEKKSRPMADGEAGLKAIILADQVRKAISCNIVSVEKKR